MTREGRGGGLEDGLSQFVGTQCPLQFKSDSD